MTMKNYKRDFGNALGFKLLATLKTTYHIMKGGGSLLGVNFSIMYLKVGKRD